MTEKPKAGPRPSREKAAAILRSLRRAGVSVVASLPDASLGELENGLAAHKELIHVPLTREEEGIGVCTGAYLGGRRAAIAPFDEDAGRGLEQVRAAAGGRHAR